MQVKVKKLDSNAKLPTYATDGSGCFDLYAVGQLTKSKADQRAQVARTGLAFEIPEGHVMLIFSRSGHGFKYGVRLSNCVGVIDSDYRGEVMVSLRGDGDMIPLAPFQDGQRVAQALVVPLPRVTFTEVDELTETERGAGGFGSTGA